MATTEVTQGQWMAMMGDNPSNYVNCGANCPVEQVSWLDAIRYANMLSAQDGLPPCYDGNGVVIGDPDGNPYACTGYRFPTESEWEHDRGKCASEGQHTHRNAEQGLTGHCGPSKVMSSSP
jgi:formylglycine-generating enzyme required for sulfatase activity